MESSLMTIDYTYLHFSAIDSTNTWAKMNAHLLDKEKINLVTADSQSGGRGRDGSHWESPSHQNIYASFCAFLPRTHPNLCNLGQMMCVTIAKVLEELGFDPKIKWPNDLLLSEKKVGGLLCELIEVEGRILAIIGLGLNINMGEEALSEIDQPATSLMTEGGDFAVSDVLEKIKDQFSKDFALFIDEGFPLFHEDLIKRLYHKKGDPITFHGEGKSIAGRFFGISDDGSLSLELDDGKIARYTSGKFFT